MIQFIPCSDWSVLEGRLIYHERGFDFEPYSQEELIKREVGRGVTSVAIRTLQIEVSISTGIALYVWGYHPKSSWKMRRLRPPISRLGCLKIISDEKLLPGVAIDLPGAQEWSTAYDPTNNWVCVGDVIIPAQAECIEFANNIVAVIKNRDLLSLWLHPHELE